MKNTLGWLVSGLLIVALSIPVSVEAAGQDISDEVFYHFMPIAWRDSDADPSRFGDFVGMKNSLDYLADSLGVTAIWMNPIHPSPAYHGYFHGAGDQVNPWFGTEAQFIDFVTTANSRGIKVFLDFVAYTVSQNTVWFTDAFNNPSSIYDSWLAFENAANTTFFGSNFTTWDGNNVPSIFWDHRDPNPTALVTQWAQKWLDPNTDGNFSDGVAGYRLDHVWQTYPNGPDGWGYHIDSFWAPWRDSLRAVNPDVFVFAEQANWGIHGEVLFEGMDATFTKPFESSARTALAIEDAGPVIAEMQNTLSALNAATFCGTYLCTISNHDVDRLASAIGSSFAKGKVAAALLMTQPFPPVIYYGDEIGMRGTKDFAYVGDAVDIPFREPFKWNAVAGSPMSNYYVLNGPAHAGSVSQNNDGRSVEEQLGVSGSLLESYRELIAVRKASEALKRGGYTHVPSSDPEVWSFVRHEATQDVLVALNLSGSSVGNTLDLSGFTIGGGSTTPTNLINGTTEAAITTGNQSAYGLPLGAYEFKILEVDVEPIVLVSKVDGLNIPSDFANAALTTQNNVTDLGDNLGELNQLFAYTTPDDFLFLGFTGNIVPNGLGLCVLLDTQSGGQNPLDLSGFFPPPYGPEWLTGLELESGFTPDYALYINTFNGSVFVDQWTLSPGGITSTYRGQGTENDGDGFLNGGTNPNSLEVAVDNTNTAGVTGSATSGAATATTGIELALHFADVNINGTTGSVKIAAFLLETNGSVSNQWLPGVGGGEPNLGIAPDMTTFPGDQCISFTVPRELIDVDPTPTPTALQLSVTNPVRTRASVRMELPEAGRVQVSVLDVQGRLVRELTNQVFPAGRFQLAWDGKSARGVRAASGMYFVRLTTQNATATKRVVLLP